MIDTDSLFYISCYGVDSLEQAISKFDDSILNIVNHIDVSLNTRNYFIVFQNKVANFRYLIDNTYKANRKQDKPLYFKELKEHAKSHPHIIAEGTIESDDLIANICTKSDVIAYIDKDLKQIYTAGLHYNYKHKQFYTIDKTEAAYNFFSQMIVGDVSDNVCGLKGKGVKFVDKLFKGHSSYFKLTLDAYKKQYGFHEGWSLFRKRYKLLRLGFLSFYNC